MPREQPFAENTLCHRYSQVISNYRVGVTHLAELLDLQSPFADDASRLTLVHQHAHVDLVAAMTGAILKLYLQ